MALIGDKAPHDPITSSWANTLRDQTIQVTTSGARPSSPAEGMTIYETDTDKLVTYNGTSWTSVAYFGSADSWSPTVTQGSTRSGTTQYSNLQVMGRRVFVDLIWACTTTGSATSIFLSSPSVAPSNPGSSNEYVCGHGYVYDGSNQNGVFVVVTTSGLLLYRYTTATTYQVALASGQKIVLSLAYTY